jgi:Positive regulator of sigma E activity
MDETGIIRKISGGFAIVRFDRKAACEHCKMCIPKEGGYVEVKVRNAFGAKVGDKVKVSMGERAALTASVIVYVVPLAITAAALAACYKFVEAWLALVISVAALAVSFVAVSLIDRKLRAKKGYFPEMVEIITKPEE